MENKSMGIDPKYKMAVIKAINNGIWDTRDILKAIGLEDNQENRNWVSNRRSIYIKGNYKYSKELKEKRDLRRNKCKLIIAGYTNDEIIEKLGLPDNETTRSNLSSRRYLYRKRGLMPASGNPPGLYRVKHTEAQIHHVCQLLQDRPDMSYGGIEKETGVSIGSIGNIYRKESWKNISKDYQFSPRVNTNCFQKGSKLKGINNPNNKYPVETIERVCDMLDECQGVYPQGTLARISREAGVGYHTVTDIRGHRIWTSVSEKHSFYKFPK